MISKLTNNKVFGEIVREHATHIVEFLISEQVGFGIICHIDSVTFEPELPPKIAKNFKNHTLFVLAGYTLESATTDFETASLRFEAGFGSENFGSLVTVPIEAIAQILVAEVVVFVNPSAMSKKVAPVKKIDPKSASKKGSIDDSFATFLKNPENSKFFG